MNIFAPSDPAGRSRRALILIQDEDSELWPGYAGHIPANLRGEGFDVAMATVLDPAVPDPDIEGLDLVVVMGSECAAYDETLPWLRREWSFLEKVDAAGIPILAICFGAQLLCRMFGGDVALAPNGFENGFISVESAVPDLLPSGRWFSSHQDQMAPPPQATVLARTEHSVQAWVYGRHLALQFHPEADGSTLRAWLARNQRVYGVSPEDAWMDIPAAIADLEENSEDNSIACRDLLRHFIAGAFAEHSPQPNHKPV